MTDFAEHSLPRRSFLRGHFLKSLQDKKTVQQGHQAIRPPWTDLANFFDKCTACDKCIAVCETQILVKGAGGYPEVNFMNGRGECTFCQACVKACEADVFRSTDERAWFHYVEIQQSCMTFSGVECRSCEDSCESRAIRFKRQVGRVAMPELNVESCNGCGACMAVCPTQAVTLVRNVQSPLPPKA